MANISGIEYEKDASGNNRYLRIDLKTHSEALNPLVKQLESILAEDDDDEFEKKWKNGITGDELFGDVIEYIKTFPWKK